MINWTSAAKKSKNVTFKVFFSNELGCMGTLLFPSGSSANPSPARAPARVNISSLAKNKYLQPCISSHKSKKKRCQISLLQTHFKIQFKLLGKKKVSIPCLLWATLKNYYIHRTSWKKITRSGNGLLKWTNLIFKNKSGPSFPCSAENIELIS